MNKSKSVAIGGILVGINVILLYFTFIIPTSKLTLLTLSSCIVPFAIIALGKKTAILVYLSSSILALILGLKTIAFMYLIFFGLYGLVKYYIESLRKTTLEIVLKVLFFNVAFSILYFLYKSFILTIPLKISIAYVIILYQIGFFIYDYAMTLVIALICKNINKLKL